jgi:hypothetical protein
MSKPSALKERMYLKLIRAVNHLAIGHDRLAISQAARSWHLGVTIKQSKGEIL